MCVGVCQKQVIRVPFMLLLITASLWTWWMNSIKHSHIMGWLKFSWSACCFSQVIYFSRTSSCSLQSSVGAFFYIFGMPTQRNAMLVSLQGLLKAENSAHTNWLRSLRCSAIRLSYPLNLICNTLNIICNSASSVTIARISLICCFRCVMLVSTWNYREERNWLNALCQMQLIMPNYLLLVHNVVSYGCALWREVNG